MKGVFPVRIFINLNYPLAPLATKKKAKVWIIRKTLIFVSMKRASFGAVINFLIADTVTGRKITKILGFYAKFRAYH
jgi:hypothetical protein